MATKRALRIASKNIAPEALRPIKGKPKGGSIKARTSAAAKTLPPKQAQRLRATARKDIARIKARNAAQRAGSKKQ